MKTFPFLRKLAPNIVRVTHCNFPDRLPNERPWFTDVVLNLPENEKQGLEITAELSDGLVKIKNINGKCFFFEEEPAILGINKVRPYFYFDIPQTSFYAGFHKVTNGFRLIINRAQGESFFGWGEWFNAFERKKGRINLDNRNALFGEQDRLTYSGLPFFISSNGYGFLLLNSFRSQWTINETEMVIEADGPNADYIIIYGPEFKEIIRTYTALTGRCPLLPRWGFGLWATSYPQEKQDNVQAFVRTHREKKIPLDALILDYHWEEKFHNFKWRQKLIPDPQKLIRNLKIEGIRLGLILTSFLNTHNRPLQKWLLNTFGQNVTPGLEGDDERALEEFDFAKKKGFLAHENVRWWFGSGGMIDYTNPEAVDWWQSKLKPLFESGVDFIKNDDGEDLPDDAVSFNGMDGREYHNIYGFYYGRATYQLNTTLKDLPGNSNPRQIIYSRNVWVGSQRFPALFLGDQEADFEGIKRSIRAGLNLAVCGFSYWTADIFGLSGKTTAEVHMRYAQWALCSPVARYFVRPQEIDNTRFPWSHNSEVTDNFRKYTELRMRLLPYYNTLAHESYKTGMPLLRPPMFEFQDDARFLSNDDQIMLGNSLMICPVVEAGVMERKIIIPKGSWYDFWTDKTWQGPTEIIYQAPLDCLPILVRGGSIVPMGPVIQNIPAGHKFDLLEYHIWPPFSTETDFYDDDGQSTAYQQGGFTSTHINVKLLGKHLEINISPNTGYFDELQKKCQIYIIIHDQNFAESAFVNKKEIQIQFTPVTYIINFEHQMNKDTQVEFLFRQ